MKKRWIGLLYKLFFTILLCASYSSVFADEVDEASTRELKNLLTDVEDELYSRGYSTSDKEGRIQKAESNLKKIVNRGSWKNAVIGSVLTAAVTAHPVGLIVGGLAGGLVGKSKNYEKAEEQFAVIEQEIIVDEDDFLTEGEIRLAKFAGEEMHPELMSESDSKEMLTSVSPEANYSAADLIDDNDEQNDEAVFESMQVAVQTPAFQQKQSGNMAANAYGGGRTTQSVTGQKSGRMELESCYGRDAESAAKKRQRLPHCFYMMY